MLGVNAAPRPVGGAGMPVPPRGERRSSARALAVGTSRGPTPTPPRPIRSRRSTGASPPGSCARGRGSACSTPGAGRAGPSGRSSRATRSQHPAVPFVLGNRQRPWPFAEGAFDAVACALVGGHPTPPTPAFGGVLRADGRLVPSDLHPAVAEAGQDANDREDGVEDRLGVARRSPRDDVAAVRRAGVGGAAVREDRGDDRLAERVPAARRSVGFPMPAVREAHP